MKSRLVQRLSALLSPKIVRRQRRKFQVGTVQRLENRHLLTAPTLDILYDLTIAEDSSERTVALTGITAGGTESQPLLVTASSSNTLLLANPTIDYTSPNSTGTLRFTPAANRSGNSIITVTVTDGGPDLNLNTTSDNETFFRTFRVTVTPVNDAPTLNPLLPLTISEDASQQTVALSGITAGPLESQPLRIRATSSDVAIIPDPAVTYTSPQNSGSIRFTPNPNRFGAVTITVTAEDGGPDSNLNTLTDNATFSRSFVVTINGQNDAPSLAFIADLSISEDAGEQTVNVTGISAGPFETQALVLSATSSNSGLIPAPAIDYTSPTTSGTLKFTPTANLFGTTLITVVLQDPGQDENPATSVDNLTFTRTFTVTVVPVNDAPTLDPINNVAINEDDAEQVVGLAGISAGPLENQTLRISAVSSVPGLIPNPSVTYASPDATGELRFTPVADQNGTAVVTVTIEDAGPDGNFATASDNASFQRTFTVTVAAVNDPPTLDDPGNLTIDEDAAEQTISLSGISAGGGESHALRVIASSDNPTLTGTPAVFYTSPNSTGSVKFTPAANLSGSATITVVVEDPGADGNFNNATDNLTATRTIIVTVNPVNDAPTLDELDNLLLSRDATAQTVNLAGITAGGGETQLLQVTTSSSNPLLIPDPTVNYSSPNTTGSISVAPAAGQSGSAVITVTVTDAGLDGDLLTTADNATVTVTFTVWVNDPPTIDDVSDVNVAEDAPEQSVNLTGISGGIGESSQKVRITATSGSTTLIPSVAIDYTEAATTGTLRFTPVADLSGSSLITITIDDAGIDDDFNTTEDNVTTTKTFTVNVSPVNDAPTLADPDDLTIAEDAAEQTVNLTGITAGGGETQPLRITAFSDNLSLIADVAVDYSSPGNTGTLRFTPVSNVSGSVNIIVVVTDGGLDGELSTEIDNSISAVAFTVNISPVNDVPTIDSLFDFSMDEDNAEIYVDLSGITAGGGESQPLRVTAVSSDTDLISIVFVDYASASQTGTLRFQPLADQSGSSTITVTVTDGGFDGNLDTPTDNAVFQIEFTVTVNPINDAPTLDPLSDVTIDEDASEQTVNLTGISAGGGENQALRVFALSGNTDLIPTPSVTWISGDATGSIRFNPTVNQFGTAQITVIVDDAGIDGNFDTADDLSVSRTFTVTVSSVNDAPTIDQPDDETVDEDAAEQTLTLTGITAGGGETQPLSVSFSYTNAALFTSFAVFYTSSETTCDVVFTPAPEVSGQSTVTMTVEDGGPDLDLATTGDNKTTQITFLIIISAVNDAPTLDPLYELTISEDSAIHSVDLFGITAGANESQPLRVTALSSDPSIVPNPSATYVSPNATGSIQFQSLPNAFGEIEITVTVTDGGLDGDLSTEGDNGSVSQVFALRVTPINDPPSVNPVTDQTVSEDAAEQTVNLSGITAGPLESQPIKVTATSGNTALIPNPMVTYTTPESTAVLNYQPIADQSGVVVITIFVEDGGGDARLDTTIDNVVFTSMFTVTVNAVNDDPTLDQPGDLTINEDAGLQTVQLTSVTAGGGETQPLLITATSNNPAVVPNPTVILDNPAVPELRFTAVADQSGEAIITVVITDGGLDGNLSTPGDNASVTRTFTVTVIPVNDAPALDQPLDVTIDEDAPEYIVALTGIAAGGGENQPLLISVNSSNSALIADPAVFYTSPNATGSLKFTPTANLSGTALITVVVTDGGLDGLLSTAPDNSFTTVTFEVTVNPINDAPTLDRPIDAIISEDASEQVISLTGISAGGGESQSLSITATSNNSSLIANPAITYTNGGTTASLSFTPAANLSGVASITVKVTDPGLDGDFTTTGDNGIFERMFTVTVNAVNDTPTLDQLGDITLSEDASEQTVNLTGISPGGGETQPLQVTATSDNSALIANPVVTYSGPSSTGAIRFTPAANLSGTAIISVVVTDGGLDGDLATIGDNGIFTRSFTVTVNAVNDAPTLDLPDNVTISEDAPEQTIILTGISAGGGETQPLQVTASSFNTTLIANPTVIYSDPNSTGSLKFTPAANLSGSTIITVVVTDSGLDGNLATPGDNRSVTRTFNVIVNAVNDAPTLDQPGNVTISEDAPEQTINLTGISAGGGETQPLQVTASSGNATLIANPAVIYSDPNSTGSLKFTPAANLSGSALITVVVTDGGLDGDLSTTGDNGSVTLSFNVTVNAVNDAPTLDQPGNVTLPEDAAEQTVSLTGISAGGDETQPLQVTATSSNTALIANPFVTYAGPNPTGFLKFTPTANLNGVAEITVVVTDGGLDGDIATTTDNASFTRTFTITVNAVNDAPTLDALQNLSILEDSALQTVQLTGITAGGGETQPLRVIATSGDPTLIPNPTVTYTSANSTGTLTFTPVTARRGAAVIVVSVEDSGPDGDFSTTSDNQIFSRSFTVDVTPIRAVVISPVGSVLVQRPQITWTAVPNAVSYTVWIDNVSAGQRPLVQATTSATTFLPSVNLGIGKIDVFIRAVTANGTQLPWSLLHRFSLVQQVVPNSINPIQPTGLPTITWPAITGAVRYEVVVEDVSRANPDFIRTVVTGPSWTPASELQLGTYRFYARGIAADDSPAWWSNTLSFTVSTSPRPIAPVTATFNRRPEFIWSAVFGATSYRLQVRNDATGQMVHDISGLADTRWTPPTALSNGNHSWIVAGFSAAGNILGNYSTRTFFFVGGRPTITAPIGTVSSVQPLLQWQNVVGAATYQVQLNRSFGGTSETVIFNISGITTNSFVPPNPLIRGASYRFWVRAVSTTGEVSVWSLPGAFTVASLEAVDKPRTSPAGIPDVSLAVLESQFERPAATVRKAAVERSQDAVDESGDSAESVLIASAAIAQHTTVMEAVNDTDATADTAAVDEAISDVVKMLLSGGLLLN